MLKNEIDRMPFEYLNDEDERTVKTLGGSAYLVEWDNALRTRVVSHGKALRLLLDCAGVADVSGFTMNGSGDSLTLTEGAVPVVGTLALTEVKA